ncbi:lmo0937 family membrane protein [Zunongwangia sp. H14]|uniref:lmo0937 family membrane protein n=1 Tax=Zunongwangia sp. H14 TaxID=3240792 RepID=UPI00356AF4ED
MRDLIWLIIVLLIIGWLVGYFAFPDLGAIIHILLVVAVILIIYKLLTGRSL